MFYGVDSWMKNFQIANFKIALYPAKISRLTNMQVLAAKQTAEKMRTEIIDAGVIPFDEGTLQNVQTYIFTADVKKGKIQIRHDTPYALRLYYHPEYKFSKLHNAQAKGEWWEEWISGRLKNRPARIFKAFLKRLL